MERDVLQGKPSKTMMQTSTHTSYILIPSIHKTLCLALLVHALKKNNHKGSIHSHCSLMFPENLELLHIATNPTKNTSAPQAQTNPLRDLGPNPTNQNETNTPLSPHRVPLSLLPSRLSLPTHRSGSQTFPVFSPSKG